MTRGRACCFAIVAMAVGACGAQAQSTDSAVKQRQPAPDARDTLFLRARKLVLDGNSAAGRALVDSALAATTGTPDYATALYWRAALASTAADAERDYRRVIIEYPFSQHSGDALLALAQLEMARGDRDPAIDHLQRFLLQRPNDPEHVRAGIWLGRLLLEQNRLGKGCAVLLRTRAALADSAVETRNQVDYYASRCADVDTVVPVPKPAPSPARTTRPDSVRRRPPVKDSARTDSARRIPERRDTASHANATPNANASAGKRFTVQVAAYQTRDSADHLVARLSARGIGARVTGAAAPFRVRVGHYASDAEATAAARELKAKGIEGFVTTTDNESASAVKR